MDRNGERKMGRRMMPSLPGLAGTALILAALCCLPGAAGAQPILDAAAVPNLSAEGRASYNRFLALNLPRAFALAPGGQFGGYGGGGTLDAARAKALASCAAMGGNDCAIYAENLDVVWHGRTPQAAAPPGPFVSTWNYGIVPDARYFWRGPAQAAGVYVWAHGLGTMNGYGAVADARGSQPQPHVRAFNNAGFDVVRFDRDPNADSRDRAAGWLEDSLADLRRRGYRKIVVGSQSRGGWNALQMLTHAGLADAVVAVSPAAHGSGGSTNLSAQYDDLRRLVGDVPAAPTRLAFVQFQMDLFAGDLAGRSALVERLRGRLGGLLVLDRPEGFTGHFGGNTARFAQRYGQCLLRFATAAQPPPSC